MKVCLFCAEEIKEAAIICRYCGHDQRYPLGARRREAARTRRPKAPGQHAQSQLLRVAGVERAQVGSDFASWLQNELDAREWNMSDLARASDVAPGVISNIMAGKRGAGVDSCMAFSRALDIPVEQAYEAAGLLHPSPVADKRIKQIAHLAGELSQEEQDEVLEWLRMKVKLGARSRKSSAN